MGTPWRSKKFHEAYYGNMGDNTLPDQVAGMKALAAKYPWIDIDRAGIYGHSGGGYATADAMFRYPDFFKVGISEAGKHDNRVYEDDWAEEWQAYIGTRQTTATHTLLSPTAKSTFAITSSTCTNAPIVYVPTTPTSQAINRSTARVYSISHLPPVLSARSGA